MYVFKKKKYKILVPFIDALGYFLFFFRGLVKKDKQPQKPRNILVIRLDHIGDAVFSTPVFAALKEKYKDARVTVLAGSWARQVFENNPNVDEILVYDAPWFKRNDEKPNVTLREMAKTIKAKGFDLGIDLRGDFRNIALMYLGGVKYRIGYGITGGGFLLSKAARYKPGRHEIQHNMDILSELGLAVKPMPRPEVFTSQADEDFARKFLAGNAIGDADKLAGVHPGAGSPAKLWDEQKFAGLIKALAKDFKIIVFGSQKEKDLVERIISASGIHCINAAGNTTLGQMAAIIKRCKAFVGTDSGPAHIAAAVATPVVSIFSNTNDPAQWGPVGGKVAILEMKSVELEDVLRCVSA